MGIDTGCMLIVGLLADDFQQNPELAKNMKANGIYETLGEDGGLGLESASPYYDSGSKSRAWGYPLASEYWGPIQIPIDTLPTRIAEAQAKFKDLTGLDAKLYVSPHVT